MDNGALPEFPSTLMALKGHYRNPLGITAGNNRLETPQERANIEIFSAQLTRTAVENGKIKGNSMVFWVTSKNQFQEGIKHKEFMAALDPYNYKPTPEMNTNRSLPLSCSIIVVNAVAHSAINKEDVLRNRPDGAGKMSIREHAAALRSEFGTTAIQEAFTLSINNDPTMDYRQCALAGARLGVLLQDETGVNYQGTELRKSPFLNRSPQRK
jgi:hypothetical protein